MNFSEHPGKRRNDLLLDLTPLLDVVFLLLIFFVLTTTFVQNPGIEVDLPKASAQSVDSADEAIIVSVTKNGEIVFEGAAIDENDLEVKLQNVAHQRPNSNIIIQADEGVRHGLVVKVLDIAQSSGFQKLAIATEQQ